MFSFLFENNREEVQELTQYEKYVQIRDILHDEIQDYERKFFGREYSEHEIAVYESLRKIVLEKIELLNKLETKINSYVLTEIENVNIDVYLK